MRASRWSLALAVLAACGGLADGPPRSPSDVADVARVVCEESGTRLITPTVRPQPDGVHILVRDDSGEDMTFVVAEIGGDDASGEQVWPVPPGRTRIGCWPDRQPEPD